MKNRYEFVLWHCRACVKISRDGSQPGEHSCRGWGGEQWEKLFRQIQGKDPTIIRPTDQIVWTEKDLPTKES